MSTGDKVNRGCPHQGPVFCELSEMIDDMPAEVRVSVLRAALSFASTGNFATDYLAGAHRSRLSDWLLETAGYGLDTKRCRRLRAHGLDQWLEPFAKSLVLSQTEEGASGLPEFVISQMEG
jgi:hypothetical protein